MSCETGSTAIEYALIAALISVAIVAVLLAVGGEVKGMYDAVERAMPKTSLVTTLPALDS
ncbi:MAG: Flp family type IVb pilin [Solirubrobacterales bacterium]